MQIRAYLHRYSLSLWIKFLKFIWGTLVQNLVNCTKNAAFGPFWALRKSTIKKPLRLIASFAIDRTRRLIAEIRFIKVFAINRRLRSIASTFMKRINVNNNLNEIVRAWFIPRSSPCKLRVQEPWQLTKKIVGKPSNFQ